MKISIAMATYNGQTYIKEQLQSLSDQTHLPDELVVGDDGSTDATLKIIDDFRAHAPFPVRVHKNETNLGYARNFMEIAKRCQGDWISFCDQDDVWHKEKLMNVYNAIKKYPDCKMILQTAWMTDNQLVSTRTIVPMKIKDHISPIAKQNAFWNYPGFLKTISKEMVDVLLLSDDLPPSWFPKDAELTHDKWTCLIANAIGYSVLLGEPVAEYRRHEKAVSGSKEKVHIRDRAQTFISNAMSSLQYQANTSRQISEYFQVLSTLSKNKVHRERFLEASQRFSLLEQIQKSRSEVHSLQLSIAARLLAFRRAILLGAYFGSPFFSSGSRGLIKDFLILFGKGFKREKC